MNAFLLFFKGWLGLYFILVHFVVPFYLVATYPKIPEPAIRFMRGLGYGVIKGPSSELSFWYMFVACGAWVGLGLLIVWRWSRDFQREDKLQKNKAQPRSDGAKKKRGAER